MQISALPLHSVAVFAGIRFYFFLGPFSIPYSTIAISFCPKMSVYCSFMASAETNQGIHLGKLLQDKVESETLKKLFFP
jgi:hypothetical protein